MADLLLELFSEEIPARLQRRGASDLERLVTEGLKAEGLAPGEVKSFGGPRRLTLVMTGLPDRQEDQREERKGPRVGAPDKALEGFLRGAGLASIEDAQVVEDKKGSFYVATIERVGRPTADILAELVPTVIGKFPWPKSMRWGGLENALTWVRPLKGILCTFGGEVVPFTVENGDRPIASGMATEGHRFLGNGVFEAADFETYAEGLAAGKVVLDPSAREERILADAQALAAAQGLELIEDRGLIAEVAGLAEWPVARIGSFDEKFLTVPDEALIASMKGHQKYISLKDPVAGRLAPKFICVANIEPTDAGQAMMRGYERVLEARLSDAWFLYRKDLETPLDAHAEKLKDVTFFEGLGTTWDKTVQVAALAKKIAPLVGADPAQAEAAARLSKADLPTEMVGEFPELQGLMGRYYALAEGIDVAVADALRDHYKPAGHGDQVPTAPVSVAVALADKLTTLALFWSIGKKPTGSGDPFALRRMALGLIQIVLENGVRLNLTAEASGVDDEVRADLLTFLHDRLTVFLKDQGYAYDHVRAALPEGADDFVLVVKKLDALKALLETPDGENLTAAYKRARNILKAEEKKGVLPQGLAVDAAALIEPAEVALHDALTAAANTVEAAFGTENFAAAMAALASMRGPLDAFFTDVTVNDANPALRANRLALLLWITQTCARVANFDQLEG